MGRTHSRRTPLVFRAAVAAAITATTAIAALLGSPLAAANRSVAFERDALLAAARAQPAGGELEIAAVPLAITGADAASRLELERFEVFAPGARIVVHTASGEVVLPPPANVYLRGTIAGDLSSRVVVSVLESGEIRGLVSTSGRVWLLGAGAGEPILRAREVDAAFELEQPGGGFRCALDDIGPTAYRGDDEAGSPRASSSPADALLAAILDAPGSTVAGENGLLPFDHTAVIAIETDNEFLNLPAIGNTTAATDYIGDLVAFASTIYTAEVQTSWVVGSVSLWQSLDPWSINDPSCGLLEFGRYWNLNHGGTVRTVSHFLSGKSTNAGIAWVGVLCRGGFSADPAQFGGCPAPVSTVGNWGGGYGFTSGIDGNFNINSPGVLWDILAFTHEIGHNFNSPHTHCYQNVGGNAASVDNCYAGQCGTANCFCGTADLPGAAGAGSGTIMSYCHLRSPGMSNVSLSLGTGHPFGVAPVRVPSRMRSHVQSVAAGNPSCLAPVEPLVSLFSNGFNSGNTNAWSDTEP